MTSTLFNTTSKPHTIIAPGLRGIESVECSTGMEWWNGHFSHFLMDGGKGSLRAQYICMT